MGKIEQGINGPFSGKVGAVVGARWKDITYIRARPKTNAKNKRSAPRIANESRFTYVNRWLSVFKPFSAIGLLNYSGRMTAYNALYSLNHALVPAAGDKETEINYAAMILSDGPLPGGKEVAVAATGEQRLLFSWLKEVPVNGKANDELMVIVYHPETRACSWKIGAAERRAGLFQLDVAAMAGKDVEVFIGFTSVDRKKASRSQYMGRVRVGEQAGK